MGEGKRGVSIRNFRSKDMDLNDLQKATMQADAGQLQKRGVSLDDAVKNLTGRGGQKKLMFSVNASWSRDKVQERANRIKRLQMEDQFESLLPTAFSGDMLVEGREAVEGEDPFLYFSDAYVDYLRNVIRAARSIVEQHAHDQSLHQAEKKNSQLIHVLERLKEALK